MTAPVDQAVEAKRLLEGLTLDNAPIGTKAPAINGGNWYKNDRGWKWGTGGGTFPRPGGDWTGQLIAPAYPAPAETKGGNSPKSHNSTGPYIQDLVGEITMFGAATPAQSVPLGNAAFVVGSCQELNAIHAVVMDIGGDWPEVDGDPYTLKAVKEMAREIAAAQRSAASRVPVASPASDADVEAEVEWEPLEEIPRERQMFDRQVELWESPQKAIAVCLSVWGSMNTGGSYSAQCNIMANEVAKLAASRVPVALPQEPGLRDAVIEECAALLDKDADRQETAWNEYLKTSKAGPATSFHTIPRGYARDLRALKATPAPKQGGAKDAERYRFAAQHLVLAGGTVKFGWPVAPCTRADWDKYLDAAILASKATAGEGK